MSSITDVLVRRRLGLGFAFAFVFILFAHPTWFTVVVGIPLTWVGLALRISSTGIIRKNQELAREGPYRITRNPLYLGSFFIGLGIALMGDVFTLTLLYVVLFLLLYREKIVREEEKLARLFGEDYQSFCREVPRFWPSHLALDEIRDDLRTVFDWNRVMQNTEYNAVLGVYGITVLMALLAH